MGAHKLEHMGETRGADLTLCVATLRSVVITRVLFAQKAEETEAERECGDGGPSLPA